MARRISRLRETCRGAVLPLWQSDGRLLTLTLHLDLLVDLVRFGAPVVLAVLAVLWVDRASARRGLLARRLSRVDGEPVSPRRYVYLALLLSTLYLGVFQVLSLIGTPQELTREALEGASGWQLFSLHFVFVCFLLSYWLLSGGSASEVASTWWPRPVATHWVRELLVGAAAGVGLWAGVLVTLLVIASIWSQLSGNEPGGSVPAMVEWIGTRSVLLRVAVALSAGVVEELFFRGFLQARIGVVASTILFVLAHFSYGQPLLILGVLLLSLAFAALVVWRRSVLAAIAAHTVFDAIQLLVVIPTVLGTLETGESTGP